MAAWDRLEGVQLVRLSFTLWVTLYFLLLVVRRWEFPSCTINRVLDSVYFALLMGGGFPFVGWYVLFCTARKV